jgi:cyclophilin family peptidyl-prolyl cis-trans isomerase
MMMFNLFPQGRFNKKRKNRRNGTPQRSLKKLTIEWLEGRQMMSVNLGSLPNIQVPGGKSVLVPLTGIDSLNGPITYSFSATDPNVQMSIVSPTSKSVKFDVTGTDGNNQAFSGSIVVQLFEDLTPITATRIEALVSSGFYNGKDFHRVLDGFVAQAGDNSGTELNDEFNTGLTFNSPGLLAMANSDSDTADSQFFITAIDATGSTNLITLEDMPEFLNFRYTIFGQLTSGFDTFEKIMSTQVVANPNINNEVSKPVNAITITSATVIDDTQDAVLRVFLPSNVSSSSITVTATNTALETSQQSFTASAVADTNVDPPFLNPISDMQTPVGVAKTFQVTATNFDSAGTVYYDMALLDDPANATVTIDHATGMATVTPNPGYAGPVSILVGVRSDTSTFDKQVITLDVAVPTLDAVSDQTTALGQPIQVSLHSTNPTGNGVVYGIFDSSAFAAPAHATVDINQLTGVVTITPETGFTGTLHLVAAVRDSASPDVISSYSGDDFDLTITAPTLNPVANQVASLGSSTNFVLSATDPTGDGLLYSVVDASTLQAPADFTVSIDPNTHAVTLTPLPGFSGNRTLLARVRAVGADDAAANYVTQQFVVSGPSIDAIADKTTPVGLAVNVTLNVTNPTTDDLTLSIIDTSTGLAPTNVATSFDPNTSVLTLTPAPGFTGTVNLAVRARTSTAADIPDNYISQEFAFDVVAPTLDPVGNKITDLGQPIEIDFSATDPTGNGIVYAIVDGTTFGAPAHVTIHYSDPTGSALITPEAGFTGTLHLVALARDAQSPNVLSSYVGQQFDLTVAAVTLATIPNQTILGTSTSFLLGTTDPSNHGLLYSIIDTTTGDDPADVGVQINTISGQVTLTRVGSFNGTLHLRARIRAAGSAEDDANVVSQDFDVVVNAPTLAAIDNKTTSKGTSVTFVLNTTDPVGAGLLYSIVDKNSGLDPQNLTININSATKQVTITPQNGIIGVRNLRVRVRAVGTTDSPESYVTQDFNLNIESPTLNPVSDKTTPTNVPVEFDLTSTISNGGTPFYSVVDATTLQAPANATITINGGHVKIQPASGFTGTLNLLARVRDANAAEDPSNYTTDAFTVTVATSVTLADPNDVQVPGTKSVLVPLNGVDTQGNPITYTASSSNPAVQVSVVSQASRSVKLNVSGIDKNNQAFSGTLVLKLFEDLAPDTTARIIQLVTSGFYNGLTIHRVADGFVAQGGANSGTTLSDEFDAGLTFNSPGLLALANAGHDTADAQFFITATDEKGGTNTPISLTNMPQFLNFGYTIFGQLVSGFDIFDKIMSVPTTANPNIPGENSKPVNTITINSAEVFTDTQNAVLRVVSPSGFTGDATITVTGTSTGGGSATQTFKATSVADTNVDPPVLGDVQNQTTTAGTAVTFTPPTINVDNVPVTYKVTAPNGGTPANVTVTITGNQIKLTPAAGFKGTINLLLGVAPTSSASNASSYDTQAFTLTVTADPTKDATIKTVADQTTSIGVPITITLTSDNPGANDLIYKVTDANFGTPANVTITYDQATGKVTLTPAVGFTGAINLLAGVRKSTEDDVQASYSTDAFILNVSAIPLAPTGLAIDPASNTGKFDGNGYVSTTTPTLTVTAKAGATVKFKLGGVVIATVTDTGTPGIYKATLPAGKLAIGANAITAAVTDAGGTSPDSTALNVTYGFNYAGGMYVVPGAVGSTQKLAFTWTERKAAYDDEIGFFVANADGSVGGIRPGQSGYAKAALSSSSRHIVFANGSSAGAKIELNLKGGQVLVFYMIQNNTTASFLANNPSNANNGNNNSSDPLAFFSIKSANPDGKKHAQIIADPTTGKVQYNWEDLASLGDSDFNDVVMTVRLATQSRSTSPVLHVPGAGNTTITLKSLLAGGKVDHATGDVGVFLVDNEDGSIGTLKPGDPGYATVALASTNVRTLMAAGASAATNIAVPAGKYLGFYTITNGSTATFLAANPSNASGGATNALFSFQAANPDGKEHFRWFSGESEQTSPDAQQLHIMNKLGGAESDFDSYRLNLSFDS